MFALSSEHIMFVHLVFSYIFKMLSCGNTAFFLFSLLIRPSGVTHTHTHSVTVTQEVNGVK